MISSGSWPSCPHTRSAPPLRSPRCTRCCAPFSVHCWSGCYASGSGHARSCSSGLVCAEQILEILPREGATEAAFPEDVGHQCGLAYCDPRSVVREEKRSSARFRRSESRLVGPGSCRVPDMEEGDSRRCRGGAQGCRGRRRPSLWSGHGIARSWQKRRNGITIARPVSKWRSPRWT